MRQKLGQHFLTDKFFINKISEGLNLKSGDIVIEIGPGHGELTRKLRIQNNELRVIAIEKDEKLLKSLKLNIKNIEFVYGDALKILPSLISNSSFSIKNYKITGNIPYYITGRLLRIISELKTLPEVVVLTIQKEVAERIIAKPPKMNLLAASVQSWTNPEIIDFISKKYFSPQPKVDSAIIRLTTQNQQLKNAANYYKLIRILFKQPRKTVLNNLNDYFKNQKNESQEEKRQIIEKIKALNIDLNTRPQNLSIETIKNIARVLYNK